MSDEQTAARGRRAFAEFSEIGFAFDAVEAALIAKLKEFPVGADAGVLKVHMSLQNLAAVRKAVQYVVDNGTIAEASMDARNALAATGLNRPN